MNAPINVLDAFYARAKRKAADESWLTIVSADGGESSLSAPVILSGALQWCRRIVATGAKPGDRAIIRLHHSKDLYLSFIGALAAGLVPSFFAPASPRQDKVREAHSFDVLLRESNARVLIVEDGSHYADVKAAVLEPIAEAPFTPSADDAWREAIARQASTAFIQYSSGTTGLKKGVAITSEMLLWQVDAYASSIDLTDRATIVSWLPIYHDMGLIAAFFMPLLTGARLVAISPFDWIANPTLLTDAIAQHRGTHCWLPNFAYKFLARHLSQATPRDLSSIRLFINCSEPIQHESHRVFLERFAAWGVTEDMLGTCYAMAETVFAVTSSGCGPGQTRNMPDSIALQAGALDGKAIGDVVVSSGKPLPGISVQVLDANGGAVGDAVVGEIAISSPGLFSGYSGKDARPARFNQGRYLTGDLGFRAGDELFVLGRSDDMIIVAGRNLFPQDIEAVADAVEGLVPGRNVAFSVQDPKLGTEALVLVAEARDFSESVSSALARELKIRVTEAIGTAPEVRIVPHMWLIKSTSGKIARRGNREKYLAELSAGSTAASLPPSAPSNDQDEISAKVRTAVGNVIKRTRAAAAGFADEDSLLTLGVIDSLSFVELLTELEQLFGRPVPEKIVAEPYAFETVQKIAACYRRGDAASSTSTPNYAKIAQARRRELAPQFADSDRVLLVPAAYVMQTPAPEFRSATANTDRRGFRVAKVDGQVVSLDQFREASGSKGIILGNSVSWGTGASQDDKVVHNVLNRIARDTVWYSFALRSSNLTQERLAAELYAPLDVDYVIWITGGMFLTHGLIAKDHIDHVPWPGEEAQNNTLGWKVAGGGAFHLGTRWTEMKLHLQREFIVFARLFGPVAKKMIVAFHSTLEWMDKDLAPQEREMLAAYSKMPHPLRSATDDGVMKELRKHLGNEMEINCARHRISYVDLHTHPAFVQKEWLFVDNGHMTDRGHEILATILRDVVRG